VPDRVKFLPIATFCPLAGSVIFTPSDLCCCGKALTEEIQLVDAKRIMTVTENTNLSDLWLKVLMYLTRGHYL
jgi:hypothetical protein